MLINDQIKPIDIYQDVYIHTHPHVFLTRRPLCYETDSPSVGLHLYFELSNINGTPDVTCRHKVFTSSTTSVRKLCRPLWNCTANRGSLERLKQDRKESLQERDSNSLTRVALPRGVINDGWVDKIAHIASVTLPAISTCVWERWDPVKSKNHQMVLPASTGIRLKS